MTKFDHEKLDVYQASLKLVAFVHKLAPRLNGPHRHARDQLLRCSQSIPLNIAEGNAKRPLRERIRFFDIARGSAMETAAAFDILVVSEACSENDVQDGKELLMRIAAMLTKMVASGAQRVREEGEPYSGDGTNTDYEYDYDYERNHEHAGAPERLI